MSKPTKKLLWELLVEQEPTESRTTYPEFCDRLLGTQATQDGFAKAMLKAENPEFYAAMSAAKKAKFFNWEKYYESLPVKYYIVEDGFAGCYDIYLRKKMR